MGRTLVLIKPAPGDEVRKANPFPPVPTTPEPLAQHRRYLNAPPTGTAPTTPTGRYLQPHQMTFDEFASHPNTKWHGSPWHDFGSGENPLVHVGSWKAAHEALSSTVAGQMARGVPDVTPHRPPSPVYAMSDGYQQRWGPAHGQEQRDKLQAHKDATGQWPESIPAGRHLWRFSHEGGTRHEVPGGLRPVMAPVWVTGAMGPGVRHDFIGDRRPGEVSAESMLRGQLKRGVRPKQGYYYKNESEGVGTGTDGRMTFDTSAVVPHRSWLKTHEDFVKDALAQGLDVPAHVLAEYPHLKPLVKADVYGVDESAGQADPQRIQHLYRIPPKRKKRVMALTSNLGIAPHRSVASPRRLLLVNGGDERHPASIFPAPPRSDYGARMASPIPVSPAAPSVQTLKPTLTRPAQSTPLVRHVSTQQMADGGAHHLLWSHDPEAGHAAVVQELRARGFRVGGLVDRVGPGRKKLPWSDNVRAFRAIAPDGNTHSFRVFSSSDSGPASFAMGKHFGTLRPEGPVAVGGRL